MIRKIEGKVLPELQGNVLVGFPHPHVRLVFVRFNDSAGARVWLAKLLSALVSSVEEPSEDGVARTLALSYAGLEKAGAPETLLSQFPAAYREGMFARRHRLLDGDWVDAYETEISDCHALLSLYGNDERMLSEEIAKIEASPEVSIVGSESGQRLDDNREHFGFVDGISQPIWEHPSASGWWEADLELDEFLLCNRPQNPLLHQGTFLVLRKLRQDVRAFRTFTERVAASFGITRDLLAAKMVGREQNGAPLIASTTGQNDFDFQSDSEGSVCPTGSHIRRAHPRQPGGRRIVRRAVPYGPPVIDYASPINDQSLDVDSGERGLLFLALTNDIEGIFEFMQREWIASRGENPFDARDPLVGRNDGSRRSQLYLPEKSRAVTGIPEFVSTLGGAYFYMPSLYAIEMLARQEPE